MNLHRPLFTSLAALVSAVALLTFQAVGQTPADSKNELELQEIVRQRPDGSVERLTVQVPVVQNGRTKYAPLGYGAGYPVSITPYAPDAESQKLMAQEQSAAQEARALSAEAQQAGSDGEKADAKKKLREKLVQIFDLQQQRRTREIAKIEERLGKLKETLKKRDSAKDSIVDRRLEAITGGVDELGWEESFPTSATPYGYPPGPQRVPMVPRAKPDSSGDPLASPRPERVPTTGDPYAPPATAPVPPSAEPRFVPPPVAPRAGASPIPVPPAPTELPASATPPVAPAPVALPVPAAPRR